MIEAAVVEAIFTAVEEITELVKEIVVEDVKTVVVEEEDEKEREIVDTASLGIYYLMAAILRQCGIHLQVQNEHKSTRCVKHEKRVKREKPQQ